MSWKMDSALFGNDMSKKVRLGFGESTVTDVERWNTKFTSFVQNAFGVNASWISFEEEPYQYMAKKLFKNSKFEQYKDTATGRQETQMVSAADRDDQVGHDDSKENVEQDVHQINQVGHGHDDYKDRMRQDVQDVPAKVQDQGDQVEDDNSRDSATGRIESQDVPAQVPDPEDQVARHDFKETRRDPADRYMEYREVAPTKMSIALEGCKMRALIDQMQGNHGKKALSENRDVPRVQQLKMQVQSCARDITGKNDIEIADKEFSEWSSKKNFPMHQSLKKCKRKGGRRNGSVRQGRSMRIKKDNEGQVYSLNSPRGRRELEVIAEMREETSQLQESAVRPGVKRSDEDQGNETRMSRIKRDFESGAVVMLDSVVEVKEAEADRF